MSKITAVATLQRKEDVGSEQTSLAFYADYNDERNKEWSKYTPALSRSDDRHGCRGREVRTRRTLPADFREAGLTSPATGKQAQRLVTVATLGGGMDPMPPSDNKNPAMVLAAVKRGPWAESARDITSGSSPDSPR